MDFDELFKSIVPTKQSILEAVDEYTLYCFYTGLDLVPGRIYNAPYYRIDNIPSFGIYESDRGSVDYMWKDLATGESGSIFELISKIHNLKSIQDVFRIISRDFSLGFYPDDGSIQLVEKKEYIRPKQQSSKIRIRRREFSVKGLEFWNSLNITESLLKQYNVEQVECYWSYPEQFEPWYVLNPTFAYRIGAYYQIYSPFADRQYKFRNDLPENYFFGYEQLDGAGEVLIIDKSCKDVIFCRRLGYNAIAPKSETTMIPDYKILELKERFRKVFIMLDNDNAGRTMTDKYLKLYPWLEPRFLTNFKDKTDMMKGKGFEYTQKEVARLING